MCCKGWWAVAALVSATALAEEALVGEAPYAVPAKQSRAEIVWVKPICVEKNRYIGWPTVCRLKSGDILAAFSGDRDRHVCPFGKVQIVRSKDNGETWSKPITVANGPIDDRDAGLVELPNGDVVLTYFTSIAYRSKSFLNTEWTPDNIVYWWKRHDEKISDEVRKASLGYFRMVSSDGGYTWSKPEKMKRVSHAPHGPVRMNDGSLFQLGRSFGDNDDEARGHDAPMHTIISAWRSQDGGKTWQCLCPAIADRNGENSAPSMFHEPNAIQLDDGTLVGLVRYHGDDHCMRETISRDGGKTWTPMTKTSMVGLPPHLVKLPDGKLVNVYGRRIQEVGCGEFAAISDDGGMTWDTAHEIALARHTDGDLGYPASCLLPDGCILTVYYQPTTSGGIPCLMATKWRVTK